MWHRSTDEGSVAGAPLLLGAGVVVAVAIAVVAGLMVYGHGGSKPQLSAVDTVRQAYLAYSEAVARAYADLDPKPLESLVTASDLKHEESMLHQVQLSGFRFRVSFDHDLLIVVFAQGNLASVDDVEVRNSTPLDPVSGVPAAAESSETIHGSFGLVREKGGWLVDSVVSFGTAGTKSGVQISYAAVDRGSASPTSINGAVERAYMDYLRADAQSLKTLADEPLRSVEIDPLLTKDLNFIELQRQRGQAFRIATQHNFRIAIKDSSTVWVYDSMADSSYPFDIASGKSMGQPATKIIREAFEFRSVAGSWKLDYDEVVS